MEMITVATMMKMIIVLTDDDPNCSARTALMINPSFAHGIDMVGSNKVAV